MRRQRSSDATIVASHQPQLPTSFSQRAFVFQVVDDFDDVLSRDSHNSISSSQQQQYASFDDDDDAAAVTGTNNNNNNNDRDAAAVGFFSSTAKALTTNNKKKTVIYSTPQPSSSSSSSPLPPSSSSHVRPTSETASAATTSSSTSDRASSSAATDDDDDDIVPMENATTIDPRLMNKALLLWQRCSSDAVARGIAAENKKNPLDLFQRSNSNNSIITKRRQREEGHQQDVEDRIAEHEARSLLTAIRRLSAFSRAFPSSSTDGDQQQLTINHFSSSSSSAAAAAAAAAVSSLRLCFASLVRFAARDIRLALAVSPVFRALPSALFAHGGVDEAEFLVAVVVAKPMQLLHADSILDDEQRPAHCCTTDAVMDHYDAAKFAEQACIAAPTAVVQDLIASTTKSSNASVDTEIDRDDDNGGDDETAHHRRHLLERLLGVCLSRLDKCVTSYFDFKQQQQQRNSINSTGHHHHHHCAKENSDSNQNQSTTPSSLTVMEALRRAFVQPDRIAACALIKLFSHLSRAAASVLQEEKRHMSLTTNTNNSSSLRSWVLNNSPCLLVPPAAAPPLSTNAASFRFAQHQQQQQEQRLRGNNTTTPNSIISSKALAHNSSTSTAASIRRFKLFAAKADSHMARSLVSSWSVLTSAL